MTDFPWRSRATTDNGFVLSHEETGARPREWVVTATWGSRIAKDGRRIERDHVVVTLYRETLSICRIIKKEGEPLSDCVLECLERYAELARDEPSRGIYWASPSFIAGYLYRGLYL